MRICTLAALSGVLLKQAVLEDDDGLSASAEIGDAHPSSKMMVTVQEEDDEDEDEAKKAESAVEEEKTETAVVKEASEELRLWETQSGLSRIFRTLRKMQTLHVGEGLLARARDRLLLGLLLKISSLNVGEMKKKVEKHIEEMKQRADDTATQAEKHLEELRVAIPKNNKP